MKCSETHGERLGEVPGVMGSTRTVAGKGFPGREKFKKGRKSFTPEAEVRSLPYKREEDRC